MVPQNYVKLENEDDIKNMEKLIDLLEDNDDVQNVSAQLGSGVTSDIQNGGLACPDLLFIHNFTRKIRPAI
mgnify:CR=1 FL=1